MTAGMADRPAEEEALGEFLDAASSAPSALLVDGEAGIGKTTLWRPGWNARVIAGSRRPRRTRRHRASGTGTRRTYARRATSGRTRGVRDDEPRCRGQAVHQLEDS
jgi:hypothetical protein